MPVQGTSEQPCAEHLLVIGVLTRAPAHPLSRVFFRIQLHFSGNDRPDLHSESVCQRREVDLDVGDFLGDLGASLVWQIGGLLRC